EPLKAVEDWLERFGTIALGIGVVDAQDEFALMLPGEQPVEQGGANAADMQIACGTGSKASTYGHESSPDRWCIEFASEGVWATIGACRTNQRDTPPTCRAPPQTACSPQDSF